MQAYDIGPSGFSKIRTMFLRSLLLITLVSILGFILWKSYSIAIKTDQDQITIEAVPGSIDSSNLTSQVSSQTDEETNFVNGVTTTTLSQTTNSVSTSGREESTSVTTLDSPITTSKTLITQTPNSGTGPVEKKIFNLTNELRKNLSSQIKTDTVALEKLKTRCPNIDEHKPLTEINPLTLDEKASVSLARDWSKKMSASDDLSHRSNGEQQSVLQGLGVQPAFWAENIAWISGYDSNIVAQTIHEGWVFFRWALLQYGQSKL